MPTEQQTKELQTRLQMFKLVSRINKGDTSAIVDELLTLLEHFKTLPKGDKGDRGEKGSKGDKGDTGKGKDGKDYVLTEKDKQAIANKIKVPIVEKIVEKVEVIKEQPIVTQQIREIAFYEDADKIADKLKNFKKAWIELSQIEGFEEYMRGFGESFLQQAKSFVPRTLDSLYDVAVRGKIINGQSLIWSAGQQKWIPGDASVGGLSPLTVSGTVNGVNTSFTVASLPSVVVSDGVWLKATNNNNEVQWTYSNGTLTMTIPPQNAIFAYS